MPILVLIRVLMSAWAVGLNVFGTSSDVARILFALGVFTGVLVQMESDP